MASRGMGRGLSAILAPSNEIDTDRGSELRQVPVDLIEPNPHQPRQEFDEGAIVALSESLQERGVLQPVLVRPVPGGTYELIAGERRWRAARLAGFDTVPALVRPDDDAASLELALIENMAREDLNPVEEARACAMLVEELGLTREDVGRRVGRSRVAVTNLLRLLDLPAEVLDLIAAGHLTEGHGRALLTASDHETRRRLARTAVQEGWSVRQTEARAREADHPRARPRRASPVGAHHPDHIEAARRLGDTLGQALGTDVRVAPRGAGYRVVVDLEDPAAAEALTSRLGAVEHA
ncbi:MAG TPA: ParB/RepB/Spo0J family partition protein [Solirubrobacteraceae bacterium]|nr:ParB/RepB/Spo0J family partition protein [Solirubrobacteraceae bacterium]